MISGIVRHRIGKTRKSVHVSTEERWKKEKNIVNDASVYTVTDSDFGELCALCIICGNSVPLTKYEQEALRYGHSSVHVCEECKNAIQRMKTPLHVKPVFIESKSAYACLNCGKTILYVASKNDKGRLGFNFCPSCGAQLDWRD